jgi:hypothetical protein
MSEVKRLGTFVRATVQHDGQNVCLEVKAPNHNHMRVIGSTMPVSVRIGGDATSFYAQRTGQRDVLALAVYIGSGEASRGGTWICNMVNVDWSKSTGQVELDAAFESFPNRLPQVTFRMLTVRSGDKLFTTLPTEVPPGAKNFLVTNDNLLCRYAAGLAGDEEMEAEAEACAEEDNLRDTLAAAQQRAKSLEQDKSTLELQLARARASAELFHSLWHQLADAAFTGWRWGLRHRLQQFTERQNAELVKQQARGEIDRTQNVWPV